MPRLYPRSFLQLLIGAFLVAALPLAVVLLQAAISVDRLAEQSRRAVGQSAEAARASRELLEQAVALERLARQYLVLEDAALLNDYRTLRGRFKETTSHLSLLPLDEPQLTELNRTIDTEQELFGRLARNPAPAERPDLARDYAELATLARAVLRVSDELTEREVAQLTRSADAARYTLGQLLGAMLLLGFAAAVVASRLVTGPIRQLDAAIRRLGDNDLAAPVAVQGPADLAQLGERLEWLRQRLNDLEAQKNRFLRHVSHELKTPLTALREGAELLADGTAGPLAEPQREIVEILRQKSLDLQRLIERLLDYQRTLDELRRLTRIPLELDALVQEVAAGYRLPAAAHQVQIALALTPITLAGDREKLATVLDNLLSNAVKHSPAGAIIDVTLVREGECAVLEVRDQGPGLDPAELGRVFEWFYRGSAGPRGPVPGSGLGLPIARELAAAHHGTLAALPGPGGRFRLTLPLTPPSECETTSSP